MPETLEPPVKTEPTEAMTAVQAAFDKAAPLKGKKKAEPEKPTESIVALVPTPEPSPKPTPEPELPVTTKEPEPKLPSFITKKEEPKAEEPEVKLEDLPREAPEDASEKVKIDWRRTRTLLDKKEAELAELRKKQSDKEEKGKELSQVDNDRLKQLETEKKQLETENEGYKQQLQRLGLQQHPRFLQEIIQPLQSTYSEAKRIITEAGGNPENLDRALSVGGKSHYEAMDEILAELPESAKGELTSVIRDYRKLAQARAQAVANAPKTLEELQRQDAQNQKQFLDSQRGEMENLFENKVKDLRDNRKFELLIKTDDKEAGWWNEIPDKVVSTAKQLFLENQDMGIVAEACVLAASAGTMRDLWLKAEERASKAEQELSEIKGAEPTLKDTQTIPASDKADLDEPFEKTFLKTLKKQAS